MIFELRRAFAFVWWNHLLISACLVLLLIVFVPYRFVHMLLAFVIACFSIFMLFFPLSYHPNVFEMAASAMITVALLALVAAAAIRLCVSIYRGTSCDIAQDRPVMIAYAICIGPIISLLLLRLMADVLAGADFVLAHSLATAAVVGSVLIWPSVAVRLSELPLNLLKPTFIVATIVLAVGIGVSAALPGYVRWHAELTAGREPYSISKPGKFQTAEATTSLSEWAFLNRGRSRFLFHGFLFVGGPVSCTSYNWSYLNARFENPRVIQSASCANAADHFADTIPFLP